MNLFYDCANLAMKALLLAFARLEVTGRENVPLEGPLLVVSNHLHIADPSLLGVAIPRRINFMGKEELFRHPLLSALITAYGTFPVKRNTADRQALRRAAKVLDTGGALGVFPEGRRNPHHGMTRAEAGVALIAHRSRPTILPVGITGTEEIHGLSVILKRPRIRVVIGLPFALPAIDGRSDSKMLSSRADEIMHRIAGLLPPRYLGFYADLPGKQNSQAEVAGEGESK
ncbi:MAG: lysophospholipid acyltransferase family protein [Dehalococcoidia bacterium]|nr:lysophospholipid acyltransferase family protein [Dehalococcoidia bacterium]